MLLQTVPVGSLRRIQLPKGEQVMRLFYQGSAFLQQHNGLPILPGSIIVFRIQYLYVDELLSIAALGYVG